jgi:hypothetical protein
MKDDRQSQSAAAHARNWNLLPWWVNGTLSSDQANDVERHLAECPACTAEADVQRALQLKLRDSDPVSIAPQSAWQKMAERLDGEDEALARGHFKSRPKAVGAWPWAVAAQTLLIAGLTTVIWRQANTPTSSPDFSATQSEAMLQPRYETLTSTPDAITASESMRVVFRRDVAVAEVNALLRQLPAQIVAGPSEAGVYTLAVPVANPNTADKKKVAADLLARVRADTRVLFAEPVESH